MSFPSLFKCSWGTRTGRHVDLTALKCPLPRAEMKGSADFECEVNRLEYSLSLCELFLESLACQGRRDLLARRSHLSS